MSESWYNDDKLFCRVMVDADIFYLTEYLMDPSVLVYFPMNNLREVEEATKVWQSYARQNLAFTIEFEGKPVGMAILYVHTSEKLKHQCLFAIVVAKEYRGKGIGTRLLRYIMKQAKEKFGVTLLHLEVYEGNPAYNLYYREGFRKYGEHKKFLKDVEGPYHTKVMMQIDLTEYRAEDGRA